MNDLVKYALLAAGGYVLYQHFAGSAAVAAVPASQPAAAAPTPPLVTDIKPLLIQKAQSYGFAPNALLNSYQWDTIYQAVRGIPGPTAAQLGQSDPSKLISVDEFWSGASGAGFSGLGDYFYSDSFARLQRGRRA